MVEVEAIANEARKGRYVAIPSHFRECETPHGFFADLPPVLTYLGSKLIGKPHSGVWCIFYTEWIAKVASILLWECYDSFRLFWVPPKIRNGIRELHLTQVLGNPHNEIEVRSLVEVIDNVDWASVPSANRCRGESAKVDLSPGRRGEAGDFIWYDPWTRCAITGDAAKALRHDRRVMPEGHPTGFVYTAEPPASGHPSEGAQGTNDPATPNVGDEYIEEGDAPRPPATESAVAIDIETPSGDTQANAGSAATGVPSSMPAPTGVSASASGATATAAPQAASLSGSGRAR